MTEFINSHPDHFLFVVLLVSRVGDILTTYVATPNLKLEGNPIVRRLRWPFAVVSILIAFIAYVDLGLALTAAGLFLLVCASNAAKMWMMRVLGEEEYLKLYSSMVQRATFTFSLTCLWAPSFFIFILGMAMYAFTGEAGHSVADGFFLYAFAIGFYGTFSYLRSRRKVSTVA
jgi:Na+-transporting NADH:ubiquinone oxidoreductase subunit NqrB